MDKKTCKSIWFMRQAGRYLPEFREIRSKNNNFINLCLDSELSSEITLQPIKRFDLDSAIIFSDILMVPFALGQNVKFVKNEGPELSELNLDIFLNKTNEEFYETLKPVYKAINLTRKKLNKEKSLIGFVGAPWTLIVYMLNLRNGKKIDLNRLINKKLNLEIIFEKLIKFINFHIKEQTKAGADVVQIFDSWAGIIPEKNFNDFCINPNKEIVKFCKKENISNICFPKGIKDKYFDFVDDVKPNGINLDYEVDPIHARKKIKDVVVQGGMDPRVLLKSDDEIYKTATKYIDAFKDIPYVFNLGHGLLPETDPDKVRKLIKFYREH